MYTLLRAAQIAGETVCNDNDHQPNTVDAELGEAVSLTIKSGEELKENAERLTHLCDMAIISLDGFSDLSDFKGQLQTFARQKESLKRACHELQLSLASITAALGVVER